MADTYAVVQKRRATSGPGSGSGACSTEGAPLYSHVTPGTRWPQAPTEEGAQLSGGRSAHRLAAGHDRKYPRPNHRACTGCASPEVTLFEQRSGTCPLLPSPLFHPTLYGSPCVKTGFLPAVPADPSPAGPGTYEDVAGGSQTSGLGFNLRIGRPKGPRDPPAEWTRV